jgi:hypothetical protein
MKCGEQPEFVLFSCCQRASISPAIHASVPTLHLELLFGSTANLPALRSETKHDPCLHFELVHKIPLQGHGAAPAQLITLAEDLAVTVNEST